MKKILLIIGLAFTVSTNATHQGFYDAYGNYMLGPPHIPFPTPPAVLIRATMCYTPYNSCVMNNQVTLPPGSQCSCPHGFSRVNGTTGN